MENDELVAAIQKTAAMAWQTIRDLDIRLEEECERVAIPEDAVRIALGLHQVTHIHDALRRVLPESP